jgi:mannose/cellobiose epimerase-like protein (N-acyl-D-glucosamine 2-epimerase family)
MSRAAEVDRGDDAARVAGRPSLCELCDRWREGLPRRAGGWADAVGPGWKDRSGPRRTFLTQSRLVYVFAHQGLRGDEACARAGAEGERLLASVYWRPDIRGWSRSVAADGRDSDPVIETYDQAFGLLALAWSYRATHDPGLPATARLAVEGLRDARETSGGRGDEGYPERRGGGPAGFLPGAADVGLASIGLADLRRQNPHMHLLEAFLAWHEADPQGPWLGWAREMVALFRERFFDRATGSLGEYFDGELRPALGDAGLLREPGHCFEWVWLLRRFSQASGDASVAEEAGRLYEFAARRGVDDDGLAFAAITADGGLRSASKPLWPQTEALKAHLAWAEWSGETAGRDRARQVLDAIRGRYFPRGSVIWNNELDRAGVPLEAPALSRLLYHLFVALVEAERAGMA